MPKLKTVLMVAPYFIPRRRVGAVRPFRFATHLAGSGYQPVVITIGHNPEQLTERESELLSDIQIINIKTGMDRTRRQSSTGAGKNHNLKDKVTGLASDWIDKQTPIDTWIYLYLSRWRSIRRQVLQVKPDLIWATGDPWSGLWLGEKLSKALNKPFIADFRDPWTLANVRLRMRSGISGRIDKYFEKRIIHSADHLVFTSDATGELYSASYRLDPNQYSTIYNSFDPFMDRIPEIGNSESLNSDNVLRLHFFGRFRRLSPVQPIVDVMNRLKVLNPEVANKIRVHSYGIPDPDQLLIIEEEGLSDHFIFEDPVEPEKSSEALQHADVLLLTTHPSRKTIIPAKLWDYLATGKPILAIVPNREVHTILSGYNSGMHCTSESIDFMTEYLIKMMEMKKRGEVNEVSTGTLEKIKSAHSTDSRTKELAGIFDRLLG